MCFLFFSGANYNSKTRRPRHAANSSFNFNPDYFENGQRMSAPLWQELSAGNGVRIL